jgi:hypothetical protein
LGGSSYADPYLYQNRLNDYRRVDVGFSKVLLDNAVGSQSKLVGKFQELFNNQNAITIHGFEMLIQK